jgi:hypothetical protein
MLVLFLLLAAPAVLGAQEEMDTPRPYPGQRLATLTAGVGNALGWFGVQGERYLLDERVSLFVGVGYTPELDQGDPTGPTFAGGIRSFTGGISHRAFVEAGVSQLFISADDGGRRLYGPGLQGGYQFVSNGGFTAMLSIGVGYAFRMPRSSSPWASQVGVSLGYTWRRATDAGRGPNRRTM